MVTKIGKHKATIGCEMRFIAQIQEYEMDQVILDLGPVANVFPKQSWERMDRLVLQWSPIQLRMENHQNIIPMGILQGVTVNIEGMSALVDFEVIKIVDENNPYLVPLGIDWAINMNKVINMKKWMMSFERK